MRFYSVVSILVIFSLFSCSEPEPEYSITFINDTSVEITVSDSWGGDFSTFTIEAGQTKSIKSKSSYILYDYTHTSTTKIVTDERITDTRIRFYDYNYRVQYKISGSASSVDVTLNNASGGTSQYDNVSVPKTYLYRSFNDDFLYISAQNQGETGTVTVQIFIEDDLYKSSTSSGAYVIATASGSLY